MAWEEATREGVMQEGSGDSEPPNRSSRILLRKAELFNE
jgi:hypothetical protein